MNEYIRFSKSEIDLAHNTNLVDFLKRRNEEIKELGPQSYWMHQGETVSIRGNVWFNFYTQEGGEAIEFVKCFFGVTFPEAVGLLLGKTESEMTEREMISTPTKEFVPPSKNERTTLVMSYLVNKRCLDSEVVKEFVSHNMLYEEQRYHNAVFVGYDKDGNPKHAHMRGLNDDNRFRMTSRNSDMGYSFHWNGTSNEMFLFEAPIDMLSYISMHPDNWQQHTYAAACSVSDKVLFQCLQDNANISKVHICLDNDEAGQRASERMLSKLEQRGIEADVLIPQLKDWNEDLVAINTNVNGQIMN